MTQHTPGPWSVDHTYQWPGKVRAANGRFVADALYGKGTPDEIVANACLIAAAPDLLAALKAEEALIKRAQDYLRMYLEPGENRIQTEGDCVNSLLQLFDGPYQRKVQSEARAAIAKAEGSDA